MRDAFQPDAALLPLLSAERRAAFPIELLESPSRRESRRNVTDSARLPANPKPTE